jgi:hypothetical protein
VDVISHGGLTFGGFVIDKRMRQKTMLDVVRAGTNALRDAGAKRLVYKAIPHIYHDVPAEEDRYALFRAGARLVRRDASSTILLSERLALGKGRKWSLKRGRDAGVSVRRSDDFAPFMAIEEQQLAERHGVRPVHTAQELELLASRFPENVKLYIAWRDQSLLGGVIVYESRNVAHAQYIASTDDGRELGALDVVLAYLLDEEFAHKRWFDFGISTVREGRQLNEGLTWNKESFGARTVVYDTYELDLEAPWDDSI